MGGGGDGDGGDGGGGTGGGGDGCGDGGGVGGGGDGGGGVQDVSVHTCDPSYPHAAPQQLPSSPASHSRSPCAAHSFDA